MTAYNPFISILIASFNAENYIEETLNSCIKQNYDNFEIIIADDCSADASLEIINNWISKTKVEYPTVRCELISSSINQGITKNFNNALQTASGEWIKCLGSDDLLLPNALKDFVNKMQFISKKESIGAVFTQFETFGENINNGEIYPLAWTKQVSKLKPSNLKRNLAMIHFNNLAPGAFINTKFINAFDTNYKMLEDLPLWLKFINNNIETCFFECTTVKYRIHAAQITKNSNLKVNNILNNDLLKVNKFRYENGYYIAVLHHKFNIYCSSKRTRFHRLLKVIDPINILIRFYERVNK